MVSFFLNISITVILLRHFVENKILLLINTIFTYICYELCIFILFLLFQNNCNHKHIINKGEILFAKIPYGFPPKIDAVIFDMHVHCVSTGTLTFVWYKKEITVRHPLIKYH